MGVYNADCGPRIARNGCRAVVRVLLGAALPAQAQNVNNAPTVVNAIDDQTETVGTEFTFTVPADSFADIDTADTLTCSAPLAGSEPLPSWLTFTAGTRSFTGTSTTAETLPVRVTATDEAVMTRNCSISYWMRTTPVKTSGRTARTVPGGQETRLRERHCRSHIQRKGSRNQPLTAQEKQGNRTRASVRVRVKHVFGPQCVTRTKLIRCSRLKRSTLAIWMMNLVYDIRRLCYLQGVSAPA